MSELEWLVALEQIKMLKARRDRYVDAHDWDAYQALHAPDHVSHNDNYPAWTSSAEMIESVKGIMENMITVHHSYDPEIVFDTPVSARGIWAMVGATVADDGADKAWSILFGYYHETYEKRNGTWLFTSRRWQRYLGMGSDGVMLPEQPLTGSAF